MIKESEDHIKMLDKDLEKAKLADIQKKRKLMEFDHKN